LLPAEVRNAPDYSLCATGAAFLLSLRSPGIPGTGKVQGVPMAVSGDFILIAAVLLLLAVAVLLLVMMVQLRAMRREVEATRMQLAKMDWGVMLLNGVQQLKQATVALEQIDKRLQKLEALEKVQLSHINLRHGV
jgi:hypothetical protein